VRDGDELLAVVPLTVEAHAGSHQLTLGGGPCWAPAPHPELDEARAAEVLRLAFAHVDELAHEHGAVRASLALSPLVPAFDHAAVRFAAAATRAGWGDVGRATQVLELAPGLEALRRGMSKGHRAAVGRGTRELKLELVARDDHAAMELFANLHARAAGRVVRPAVVFRALGALAGAGHGLLALARRDGEAIGASYVNLFGPGAYYSMAAVDPEHRREPVGHALQWAVLEWLAEHGIERYELGLQQFGPLPHDVPNEKELAIARFKRGFGGVTRPFPVREKWYSAAAFERAARERADAYVAALSGA
jgi:GNAT superfamily N-acetyltransferase